MVAERPELTHCRKRVVIPFVIPLESRGATQSQGGTGGFGKPRDATLKVESTRRNFNHPKDAKLSVFAATNSHASQRGMSSFGAPRDNVLRSTLKGPTGKAPSTRDWYVPKLTGCGDSLSKRDLNGVSGQSSIGAGRPQVLRIRPNVGGENKPKHSYDPSRHRYNDLLKPRSFLCK